LDLELSKLDKEKLEKEETLEIQKKLLRFLHLKHQFSDQVKLLKKLLISKKKKDLCFFKLVDKVA